MILPIGTFFIIRKPKAIVSEMMLTTRTLAFFVIPLDFKMKKFMMRYGNKKSNQILSEFAYRQITECIKSRCIKEKVSLKEINPAYTSRIAEDKYMKSMGCSVHMAASYVIARRGCGYIDII